MQFHPTDWLLLSLYRTFDLVFLARSFYVPISSVCVIFNYTLSLLYIKRPKEAWEQTQCYGLSCFPQIHMKSYPPVPPNVTLSGDRVVAAIIKDEVILE